MDSHISKAGHLKVSLEQFRHAACGAGIVLKMAPGRPPLRGASKKLETRFEARCSHGGSQIIARLCFLDSLTCWCQRVIHGAGRGPMIRLRGVLMGAFFAPKLMRQISTGNHVPWPC